MADKRKEKEKNQNQNIQVFVRIRPVNSQEKSMRSHVVVEAPSSREISVTEKTAAVKSFSFDRVFPVTSKQVEVYKAVAAPLVNEVLSGYNCTVFAYGQTGTGKTYTMEGEHSDATASWENDPGSGIIPRTLSHLFDELRIQEVECMVRVSFIEIYNEEIYDLLSATDDTTKLRLFEDSSKKGSVIVQGMEEVTVHNKNEVYNILAKGSLKRQTAATLMNAHSSRSHTIFSITVHIKENSDDGEELMKIGKLNLVDLAGSENIGRSGAVDRRAREAGNINQSLLTLGRVITSLVERTPHIPYRESKLTRLLQDSLGGRTKTSIIATVSPAAANIEETLSTLDYAHRAKNITNRPEVNQKLTKKALLKEYTEEIERLRRDLLAAREKNGVFIASENYEQMTREIEDQRKEIVQKLGQIRAMEEELARKESAFVELQQQFEEKQKALEATKEELGNTKHQLSTTRSKLKQTRQQRDEQSHLVNHHVHTEEKLGTQAKNLLEVADTSTDHVRKLHSKLDRKRSVEEENERISQHFRQSFAQKITLMEDNLSQFSQAQTKYLNELSSSYGTLLAKRGAELTSLSELMSSLVKSQSQFIEGLHKSSTDNTHSTQEFIKSFLASARNQVNAQNALQHTFLVEGFLPKMQSIAASIQEQAQGLQQLQRMLVDGIGRQTELVTVLLTDQRDMMSRLSRDAQQWDQQTENSLRFMETERAEAAQRNAEADAELNKKLSMMMNLVTSIQQDREAYKSRQNQTDAKQAEALQKVQNERSAFYHTVETMADEFVSKGKDWNAQYETSRAEIVEAITSGLEKGTEKAQDAGKTCAALEGDVSSHVTATQAAWQELYSAQETDLRKLSDNLNGALRGHGIQTNEQLTSLHLSAQTHETLLEEQRSDFSTRVRERQNDCEAQVSALADWTALFSSEVKQRNDEVAKFVNEDLRHDVPTGHTPQRRDFSYPRYLASTSPHGRILERFRQAYNEEEEMESDDDSEQMPPPRLVQRSTSLVTMNEAPAGTENMQAAFSMTDISKANSKLPLSSEKSKRKVLKTDN